MLTIRLQRTGKRNAASFRIVVAEKTAHVSKKIVEVLGHYDARRKDFNIKNPERLQHWIGHNVALSPTMHNMLVNKGLLKAEKVKAFNIPKKEAEPEKAPEAAAPTEETPAEAPKTEEAPAEAQPEQPAA